MKQPTKWKRVGHAWLDNERATIDLDEPVGGRVFLFLSERRVRALAKALERGQDTSGIERWPTHNVVVREVI